MQMEAKPLSNVSTAPLQTSTPGVARPAFSQVTIRQLPAYLRVHVLGFRNMANLFREFKWWYHNHYFVGGRRGPILHYIAFVSAVGWTAHSYGTTLILRQ